MNRNYNGWCLRLWCVISLMLFIDRSSGHRKGTSDSILEIINTEEVERLIAARRLNQTKTADRRYLAQNDLEEEFLDSNPRSVLYDPQEYDKQKSNNRIGIDILMTHYNQTGPYQSPELLAELAAYHGRKLLRSSKNALVVTKKEYLKKDWCKTEPLVQRVKEEGCLSRTVINRFCYGQCNSFYIPKNPRRRRGRTQFSEEDERDDIDQNGAAFKSCAFCKPKKFTWITVTFRCPSLIPPYRKKRIQRIKQCKCTAANVN